MFYCLHLFCFDRRYKRIPLVRSLLKQSLGPLSSKLEELVVVPWTRRSVQHSNRKKSRSSQQTDRLIKIALNMFEFFMVFLFGYLFVLFFLWTCLACICSILFVLPFFFLKPDVRRPTLEDPQRKSTRILTTGASFVPLGMDITLQHHLAAHMAWPPNALGLPQEHLCRAKLHRTCKTDFTVVYR